MNTTFKKKILIVDDDQDTLHGLNIRLRANGYETAFATDAVTAVSVTKNERPDLILLDLGLPGGDGYMVMERVRSLQNLGAIPVIVLSAKDPLVHQERSLKSGAAAFFQKPVDNDILLAAIRKSLQDGQSTEMVEESIALGKSSSDFIKAWGSVPNPLRETYERLVNEFVYYSTLLSSGGTENIQVKVPYKVLAVLVKEGWRPTEEVGASLSVEGEKGSKGERNTSGT